jgi:hypothetical protein
LKKPQKKTTRQGCHSLKKLKTMNTVTQPTQPIQDKAAAKFDVALSLPPATTDLNSEYFQEYVKQVALTGNTPF